MATILFWLQLADVRFGIAAAGTQPAWKSALPALIAASDSRRSHAFPFDMVIVALLESAVFWVLARFWVHPRRFDVIIAVIGVAVMFAMAVDSRVLTSNDVYAYIGYAKLPSILYSYAPPNIPLAPDFFAINRIWKQPLLPCAYGPLWLAFNWVEFAWVPNLHVGLIVARTVNFAELCMLSRLLALLAGRRVALLVLINPAIMFEFVVNAHNDLLAALLLVVSMTALRRGRAVVAAIVGGAAAMLKLPFGVLAVATLGVKRPETKRSLVIGIIVIVGLAGSLLLGGFPYFSALHTVAAAYEMPSNTPRNLIILRVHEVEALAAICGTIGMVFLGLRPRSTPWSLSAISVSLYPNYLIWGLPTAVAIDQALSFLIALPAVALIADYAFTGSALLVQLSIVGLFTADFVHWLFPRKSNRIKPAADFVE